MSILVSHFWTRTGKRDRLAVYQRKILGNGRRMQIYSLTFSRTETEIFDSCGFTVEKTSISASAVFHCCLEGVSE